MTQLKPEAVFFVLCWSEPKSLKWQPATTKARGLLFTSCPSPFLGSLPKHFMPFFSPPQLIKSREKLTTK